MAEVKICVHCDAEYSPHRFSNKTQKYCSRRCKEANAYERQRIAGIAFKRKGGYSRTIYVTKFMEARLSDDTAPCTYCKKRLEPDGDWVLDHKIPLSQLTEDFQRPDNLCLCCADCNRQKSNKYTYEEFLALKKDDKI